MNVILQENYPSLGYIGDIVSVRPGFARNFLIPRGIALEAASKNAKLLRHRIAGINAKREKMKSEAKGAVERLEKISLSFVLKAGQQGSRSFGAITSRDIEAALKKEEVEVNKKQIRLHEPIKGAGEYRVEIKVHAEVSAFIPVHVTTEFAAAPKRVDEEGEEGDEGGKKARKPRGGGKKKGKEEEPTPEASAPDAE